MDPSRRRSRTRGKGSTRGKRRDTELSLSFAVPVCSVGGRSDPACLSLMVGRDAISGPGGRWEVGIPCALSTASHRRACVVSGWVGGKVHADAGAEMSICAYSSKDSTGLYSWVAADRTKRKEEREGMEEEWAGRMDGDPGEHAAGQER